MIWQEKIQRKVLPQKVTPTQKSSTGRPPLKWIPRSKLGASKSRPRWAAHTLIGNVWEYPPPPPGFIVRSD